MSVYCVFADAGEAERLGRQMVEERLAACVNILGPCRSIYRWQGAIETSEEVAAIFKTGERVADALVTRLSGLHSYEVPAITVWPIAGTLDDYGKWIESSTR